jgi:hypothetical protein
MRNAREIRKVPIYYTVTVPPYIGLQIALFDVLHEKFRDYFYQCFLFLCKLFSLFIFPPDTMYFYHLFTKYTLHTRKDKGGGDFAQNLHFLICYC